MKLLITGFEPFGGDDINPSNVIAEKCSGTNRVIFILPVSYQKTKDAFLKTVEEEKHDYILDLGLNASSESIHIEKYAYNLMSAKKPDNDGTYKNEEVIIPGAKERLSSLVDTALISTLCQVQGIKCVESEDPGRYICNMTYYLALSSKTKAALFVHLPKFSNMSSENMVSAVNIAIEVLTSGKCDSNNNI